MAIMTGTELRDYGGGRGFDLSEFIVEINSVDLSHVTGDQ